MAEGWAQHLKDKVIEPYSAGIIAHGLNPRAVAVMKETGIDISHHSSKDVGSVMEIHFDHVITVCSHAELSCPVFPGKTKSLMSILMTPLVLQNLQKVKRRPYLTFAA